VRGRPLVWALVGMGGGWEEGWYVTFSIAVFTRSLVMRPFCWRLVMSSAFVAPELRHAMLDALMGVL